MTERTFHVFAGTRPEVVKMGPVVHALRAAGADVELVATGQQSDPALIDATFAAAGLKPDTTWDLGDGDYLERAGVIHTRALEYLRDVGAGAVALVQGDTTTVPVVAHAARRNGVPVVHVEAGLRSFNPQSLEETNRKFAAMASSIHFAPTTLSARFLQSEGVPAERVFVVGNTACDALLHSGVEPTPLAERSGTVVTAHRATNVDDPGRLAEIVDIVIELAGLEGPVTFPVHPRSEQNLHKFGLYERLASAPGVSMSPPLPYTEMLRAISAAKLIVTDSGGLQEEAAWFGVPVIVMRYSTPRWEGVANGTTALAGVSRDKVLAAAVRMLDPESLQRAAATPCPYGSGDTGERIAAVLTGPEADALLVLEEPDYTDGSLPADLQ